jgi:hypothetical protein
MYRKNSDRMNVTLSRNYVKSFLSGMGYVGVK